MLLCLAPRRKTDRQCSVAYWEILRTHGLDDVKLSLSHTGVSKTEALMANKKNPRWGRKSRIFVGHFSQLPARATRLSRFFSPMQIPAFFSFLSIVGTPQRISHGNTPNPSTWACLSGGVSGGPLSLFDYLGFAERTLLLPEKHHTGVTDAKFPRVRS